MFMLFALLGLILAMVIGFMVLRARARSPLQPRPSPGGHGASHVVTSRAPSLLRGRAAAAALPGGRPGSAMDQFTRGDSQAATLKQPWGVPAGLRHRRLPGARQEQLRRLQAAWDTGNLDQLAEFTTQEMFTELTHELHNRGGGHSRSEIVTLDAALLGIESGATEHLASVRFDGTLRVNGEIEQVKEVWNLAKPVNGSTGWLLAGIQQLA